MKFSLLVLSTLTIGAIAVAPGKGEDENHNMSKDIPLTPDEKPQDAKNAAPSSTEPKPSPSPALDANAGSPTPTDVRSPSPLTPLLCQFPSVCRCLWK